MKPIKHVSLFYEHWRRVTVAGPGIVRYELRSGDWALWMMKATDRSYEKPWPKARKGEV